MQARSSGSRLALALLLAAAFLLPGAARAQRRGGGDKARIETLARQAMDQYDQLEFDKAKRLLEEALGLARKAGLDEDPLAAALYVDLGVVLASGLKDGAGAAAAFQRALQIDSAVELDPGLATPEVQQAWDAAKKALRATAAPEEPPPTEIDHTPVDEAPRGRPVTVRAELVGPKGTRLFLLWRAPGSEQFDEAPFKRKGAALTAEIPGSATRARTVQYYLEARDADGKVAATSADEGSPHLISITDSASVDEDGAGAAGDGEGDAGDGGDGERRGSGRRGRGDDGDGSDAGEEDGEEGPRPAHHSLYVAVAVGAGGGFVTGKTEVADSKIKCCVAFAPLHIAPEIGMFLGARWQLSAVGRIQLVTLADAASAELKAASGALAAMARLRYNAGADGRGFYVHLDVGGGEIRHAIDLGDAGGEATGSTDTARGGPFLVGGGLGVAVSMGKVAALVLDATTLVFAPDVSANVDLNLGLSLSF